MTSGTSYDKFHVASDREEKFKRLLKSARELRGWSQMKAAEESGVAQTVISEMERGVYPGMRLWDIWKLCRTYGFRVSQVLDALGWTDESESKDAEVERRIALLNRAFADLSGEELDHLLFVVECFVVGVQQK